MFRLLVTVKRPLASALTLIQAPVSVEDRRPTVGEVTPEVKPKPEPAPVVTKPVIAKPIVVNPLTDPGNILSKRSIFYDYDSDVVKDEFKPIVTAHAQYLMQNRNAKIAIQGNTDERGSRERPGFRIDVGRASRTRRRTSGTDANAP